MKHSDTQAVNPAANDEPVNSPEWVLASKFEELTGVTRETVKQRKKAGTWREGAQVAVVHRRLYVNIKAADQWIKDHLPKQHRPA